MLHLTSHPGLHGIFEFLGYIVGYTFYRHARQLNGDHLPESQRWTVTAAAVSGAFIGSRLLGFLEQAPRFGFDWRHLLSPTGGKTIVGALLGGWLAVEVTKHLAGIRTRTGDLFAIPLTLGIATGRIGCLLAGLADDTYGTPSQLPWAVDFGDGIPRHPTQFYEILFLLALTAVLHRLGQRPHPQGALFRVFLAAYLAWRFLVEFIKPQPHLLSLDLIQWASLCGLLALALSAFRDRQLYAK